MKSEILHRMWIRQRPRTSPTFKLRQPSGWGLIAYRQARRSIKKRGRLYDLRIHIGERNGVKGAYRHIHSLPIKPLRMGRRKSKLLHCDWAKIDAKQRRPVRRQELEGVHWIELYRWDD